jgi:hypothetical protein
VRGELLGLLEGSFGVQGPLEEGVVWHGGRMKGRRVDATGWLSCAGFGGQSGILVGTGPCDSEVGRFLFIEHYL